MARRLTTQQRLLREVSETAWQGQVEAIATLGRWRYYHAPDNRPVTASSGRRYVQNVKSGFPDLTLVQGPRLLFVELKRETGILSAEQIEWLTELQGAGAEVGVWRPSDVAQVDAVLIRGEPMPAWVPVAAAVPVTSTPTPGDGRRSPSRETR